MVEKALMEADRNVQSSLGEGNTLLNLDFLLVNACFKCRFLDFHIS